MTDDTADRTAVRALDDVDEFLGTDGETYTLAEGDVDALPTENATALVERGAAERVIRLDDPPEPIVAEDGTVSLVQPRDDGRDVTAVDLGTWECQRCGAEASTPVRSGETEPPHECPSCERQGPFQHVDLEDLETRIAAFLENVGNSIVDLDLGGGGGGGGNLTTEERIERIKQLQKAGFINKERADRLIKRLRETEVDTSDSARQFVTDMESIVNRLQQLDIPKPPWLETILEQSQRSSNTGRDASVTNTTAGLSTEAQRAFTDSNFDPSNGRKRRNRAVEQNRRGGDTNIDVTVNVERASKRDVDEAMDQAKREAIREVERELGTAGRGF